jgi:uncharacterized protein (TIGR03435 family)
MRESGILVLVLHVIFFHAQSPTATLQFDVASIKPALPNENNSSGGLCRGIETGSASPIIVAVGRCRFVRSSLARIVAYAYSGLPVEGGPKWTQTDVFDVEATAPDPSSATTAQLIQMLQQLLADRFQLQFHRVMKEVKGYSLVISKNGLKMKEMQADASRVSRGGPGLLIGNGDTSIIAFAISRALRMPVSDDTGLKAMYAISLKWTPDGSAGPLSAAETPPPDPTGVPSIFTAVQEQLGLRLEPTKVTVENLVIDSAQQPSSN